MSSCHTPSRPRRTVQCGLALLLSPAAAPGTQGAAQLAGRQP